MSERIESALTVYGWRVVLLHLIAKLLRVHFSAVQQGFGASPRRFVWTQSAVSGGYVHAETLRRWAELSEREQREHRIAQWLLKRTGA